MDMKKLFLFSLLSFAAYAQVQIQVVDPDVDPASFEGDHYQVKTKSLEHDAIPEIEKRDAFFENTALPARWDQLDRDIFYMDLKSKSLEKLQRKYPDFDIRKLQALKAKRG